MIEMQFKYFNPVLNIVFNNWQQVYLVEDEPVLLKPAIHRSALIYRLPITGRRISYTQIKQHFVKK